MPIRPFSSFLIALYLSMGALCAEEKRVNYSKLLGDTCSFFETIRSPSGAYLDTYFTNAKHHKNNHRISSASTGIGLVSLCIAHQISHDSDSAKKALHSLRHLNGKGRIKPLRNANGLFLHFYDDRSGTMNQKEFSTIDTALLVAGANICKNTFKENKEIQAEVTQLWNSINWSSTKVNAKHYWLSQDQNGKGKGKTRLFNEYLLLADFCSASEKTKPIVISDQWIRCELPTGAVLSDLKHRALPLFTFQFVLYLSPVRANDAIFLKESLKAAEADKAWWRASHHKLLKQDSKVWGSSAGSDIKGYGVNSTAHNPHYISHAPALAGFSPFSEEYKKDFEHLIQTYPEIFIAHNDQWAIPWRLSFQKPEWRPKTIQGIDLAPLLFGLAANDERIGWKFFQNQTLPIAIVKEVSDE